jgi:hypothetical protein
MNYIYGLVDPRTGELRYVGISKVSANRRLKRHIKAARNGSTLPVHIWLRKLIALGVVPMAALIEEAGTRQREVFWIAHYRAAGAHLLNCTRGGDGLVNPSPETRQKMSEARRRNVASGDPRMRAGPPSGRALSPEHRAKVSAALKGKPKTEAHRRNAAAALNALRASGQYRAAKGDANGLRKHPEAVLRGASNPQAKLTEDQVREMRARYVRYKVTSVQLAKEYGVSQAVAWNAIHGVTWKHVPRHGDVTENLNG